jgi:two-component system, cell cycle sensor histidine kinase and response regulator CckA
MATSSSKPPETILVVDDEPEVLSMASDMLRMIGYSVLTAGDSLEAIRIAQARTGPLQLLLTDIVMPVMTGRDLAEEVRAIRPNVKVLFMSAYSPASIEKYRVRLGPGEPFLAKPFTIAQLRETVRHALIYRPPSELYRSSMSRVRPRPRTVP